MKYLAVFVLLLSFVTHASASTGESRYLSYGTLNVRYQVYEPKAGRAKGNVLYIHGYGDTVANHSALFEEFLKSDLRVVGFDLPSHGLTTGQQNDDLDFYTFSMLAKIANSVLREIPSVANEPLIIAGWSLGGLIAIRIAQSAELRELFPPIIGLVLYTPGVSVKKCVGNTFCQITNDTLTHNRDLQDRAIQPKSPIYRVAFAANILYQSLKAQHTPLPRDIPVLLFVAGDEQDKYVNSKKIREWAKRQRAEAATTIIAYQCPAALHELDNEPAEYGGSFVRQQSAAFARNLVSRVGAADRTPNSEACFAF